MDFGSYLDKIVRFSNVSNVVLGSDGDSVFIRNPTVTPRFKAPERMNQMDFPDEASYGHAHD